MDAARGGGGVVACAAFGFAVAARVGFAFGGLFLAVVRRGLGVGFGVVLVAVGRGLGVGFGAGTVAPRLGAAVLGVAAVFAVDSAFLLVAAGVGLVAGGVGLVAGGLRATITVGLATGFAVAVWGCA